MSFPVRSACCAVCLSLTFLGLVAADEYLNGIKWEEPKIVKPGEAGQAPSDAVVLFDGKDMSAWENAGNWKVVDGAMVSGKGDARTKESFGDCQLHIEWSAPVPAKGSGQGRGNSGVFLMNTYEIQVLDSYDNTTYFDGQAGAIYKQTPPQVNAMRPPGEWNVYDIVAVDGVVKLAVNGKFVNGGRGSTQKKGYLCLESEGAEIRFRNIKIMELPPGVTAPGQTAPELD